jgi:hypothetical protein
MSYRETPEVSKAVVRLTKAVGRRVAADGNPEYLEELVAIEKALEEAYKTAVAGLRAGGQGDPAIARALGVTKQAVGQRWPRGK